MKAAPARSLADDGTAFERQLLESARDDAMPAASLERLARALSVPSAPAGSHELPSRLARQGSLMKLGAWGLIGATAVTAALHWLAPERSISERNIPQRTAPPTLEPAVPQAPAPDAPALQGPASERSAEHPEASVSPRRPRAAPRRSAPRETRASAAETGGLRAELLAVEAIQRALRAGHDSDAERQLADYARRFPRGELALEAELLRVDLDVARGNLGRARTRARQLLARSDAARYRRRLEALTQNTDGSDPD